MEHHDNDDNDDHFHNVEREEAYIGHREKRLADNPLLCYGFNRPCPGDREVSLVAEIVVVSLGDIPAMSCSCIGVPDIAGVRDYLIRGKDIGFPAGFS